MNKRVLVVVAHADDEVLGCGGAIARHRAEGDIVEIAILSDGVSSRGIQGDEVQVRRDAAEAAASVLDVSNLHFFSFPDNSFDTISILDLTQTIEALVASFLPTLVYTHFCEDLNVDHRRVSEAVTTACRPMPGRSVKEVRMMEVSSSTEWRFQQSKCFFPDLYIDISTTLEKKLEALHCYDEEMRDYPHARSYQAIENLACHRGATVGFEAAEAFKTVYRLE